MRFTIAFHQPFRVATGAARPGLDATVDPNCWLPTTSLKGVMRAAGETLGIDSRLLDAVYGAARSPSPWSWSDVDFSERSAVGNRARIRINPETGTVARGALLLGEEVWATAAAFDIDRRDPIEPGELQAHEAVLRVSAATVRSIGSDRNRGLGWVTITPDRQVDAQMIAAASLPAQRRPIGATP